MQVTFSRINNHNIMVRQCCTIADRQQSAASSSDMTGPQTVYAECEKEMQNRLSMATLTCVPEPFGERRDHTQGLWVGSGSCQL